MIIPLLPLLPLTYDSSACLLLYTISLRLERHCQSSDEDKERINYSIKPRSCVLLRKCPTECISHPLHLFISLSRLDTVSYLLSMIFLMPSESNLKYYSITVHAHRKTNKHTHTHTQDYTYYW